MPSLPSLNMFYIFVSINQSLKSTHKCAPSYISRLLVIEGKMGLNRIVSKFYSEHRQ